MSIEVKVEPQPAIEAGVDYRWDSDTDILTANCRPLVNGEGVSGSIELAGSDGSWLILDLSAGLIQGVEVAVWPDVRQLAELRAPASIQAGRLHVNAEPNGAIASIEVTTSLVAEADRAQRTVHFKVGSGKPERAIGIADSILVELDAASAIAGVWLLNVPPFPEER